MLLTPIITLKKNLTQQHAILITNGLVATATASMSDDVATASWTAGTAATNSNAQQKVRKFQFFK
jgi:hypothetical protein